MSVPESMTVGWRNDALDAAAGLVTHIGLVDETGTEITGGAPAYARQVPVWLAAVAGIQRPTADLTFDIPAGVYVNGWCGFDALVAGTNYGGKRLQRVSNAAQWVYTLEATQCGIALTEPA